MSKCLYCYKELVDGEVDFHKGCAKKFFGMQNAPELPYSLNDLDTLAAQVIKSQTTLTGVQAKLSLHLDRHENQQDSPLWDFGAIISSNLRPRHTRIFPKMKT